MVSIRQHVLTRSATLFALLLCAAPVFADFPLTGSGTTVSWDAQAGAAHYQIRNFVDGTPINAEVTDATSYDVAGWSAGQIIVKSLDETYSTLEYSDSVEWDGEAFGGGGGGEGEGGGESYTPAALLAPLALVDTAQAIDRLIVYVGAILAVLMAAAVGFYAVVLLRRQVIAVMRRREFDRRWPAESWDSGDELRQNRSRFVRTGR